jgi:hypothetical protein
MKIRIAFASALAISLSDTLLTCANPESVQATRQAAQAAADAKDEAKCREKGLAPGTTAFDECRARLAQAAAEQAAIQEQRRIEFQKTLGVGTTDYTGH